MKKTVALIFGGEGYEHDISLLSAENLAASINTESYRIVYIFIDRSGDWYLWNRRDYESPCDISQAALTPTYPVKLGGKSGFLAGNEIISTDIAIPCLHGDFGEDGIISGVLTAAHIDFIGQNVTASVITGNKDLSKLIARQLSIPTAKWITAHGYSTDIQSRAEEQIGYPMFIKPLRLGSSYGAHPVLSGDDFKSAYLDALGYSSDIIIEEYIDLAYEIECAYFDGKERMLCPQGRILGSGFYGFREKYGGDGHKTDTAPGFDTKVEQTVKEYAERLTELLGLRYLSRLDFFVTPDGKVYFNEINSFPGMTKTSLYPKLCENMGLARGEFINVLIEKAIYDRNI